MITSPAATPAIFSISSAPLANASFGDAARLVERPIIGEPLHPRELRPLILKAFSPLPPQEDLGPIGQLHIAQISDLAAKNFAFQALVGYHAMASNWALRAGSPEITCQYCAALKEHSISATQESCDNIGQIAQNAALMRSPAASKTVEHCLEYLTSVSSLVHLSDLAVKPLAKLICDDSAPLNVRLIALQILDRSLSNDNKICLAFSDLKTTTPKIKDALASAPWTPGVTNRELFEKLIALD